MTAEQMAVLAAQVPDLALAATLTMFVTAGVLAWVPRRLGALPLPALDGGRVWVVVFLASMGVVTLMSPVARLDRPFLLASLAVTVVAITGNTALDRLDAVRASRDGERSPSTPTLPHEGGGGQSPSLDPKLEA